MCKKLCLCLLATIFTLCTFSQAEKKINRSNIRKATALVVKGDFDKGNALWSEVSTHKSKKLKPKYKFCKVMVRRFTAFKTDTPPFEKPKNINDAHYNIHSIEDLIAKYDSLEDKDKGWLIKKFSIDRGYIESWKKIADNALENRQRYIDSLVTKYEKSGNDSLKNEISLWNPDIVLSYTPSEKASEPVKDVFEGPLANTKVEKDPLIPEKPIEIPLSTKKLADEEIDKWKKKANDLLQAHNGEDVSLLIQSAGAHGEHLIIEMSYYFNKERDGFELGQYIHPGMPKLVGSFMSLYNDEKKGKKAHIRVEGYADANVVGPNSVLYNGEFGKTVEIEVQGKKYTIIEGNYITNEQLAVLRLYHGIRELKQISKNNIEINETLVVEYENKGDQYKGPQYRRVVFHALVYNYFLTDKDIEEIENSPSRSWVNRLEITEGIKF